MSQGDHIPCLATTTRPPLTTEYSNLRERFCKHRSDQLTPHLRIASGLASRVLPPTKHNDRSTSSEQTDTDRCASSQVNPRGVTSVPSRHPRLRAEEPTAPSAKPAAPSAKPQHPRRRRSTLREAVSTLSEAVTRGVMFRRPALLHPAPPIVHRPSDASTSTCSDAPMCARPAHRLPRGGTTLDIFVGRRGDRPPRSWP